MATKKERLVQMNIRVPVTMKESLAERAAKNERTLTQQVIYELRKKTAKEA